MYHFNCTNNLPNVLCILLNMRTMHWSYEDAGHHSFRLWIHSATNMLQYSSYTCGGLEHRLRIDEILVVISYSSNPGATMQRRTCKIMNYVWRWGDLIISTQRYQRGRCVLLSMYWNLTRYIKDDPRFTHSIGSILLLWFAWQPALARPSFWHTVSRQAQFVQAHYWSNNQHYFLNIVW